MAGKVGAALGYDMGGMMGSDEAESPDETEPPASAAEPKGGSAEVMAMKMFSKATSPEAKVSAMKAFLEACGCISGE